MRPWILLSIVLLAAGCEPSYEDKAKIERERAEQWSLYHRDQERQLEKQKLAFERHKFDERVALCKHIQKAAPTKAINCGLGK